MPSSSGYSKPLLNQNTEDYGGSVTGRRFVRPFCFSYDTRHGVYKGTMRMDRTGVPGINWLKESSREGPPSSEKNKNGIIVKIQSMNFFPMKHLFFMGYCPHTSYPIPYELDRTNISPVMDP